MCPKVGEGEKAAAGLACGELATAVQKGRSIGFLVADTGRSSAAPYEERSRQRDEERKNKGR
jgi:hypothetical protein